VPEPAGETETERILNELQEINEELDEQSSGNDWLSQYGGSAASAFIGGLLALAGVGLTNRQASRSVKESRRITLEQERLARVLSLIDTTRRNVQEATRNLTAACNDRVRRQPPGAEEPNLLDLLAAARVALGELDVASRRITDLPNPVDQYNKQATRLSILLTDTTLSDVDVAIEEARKGLADRSVEILKILDQVEQRVEDELSSLGGTP
jgi:hypothetical protein